MCNFVAVYLTSVQFILQLKLRLYTIVHLLLEDCKISLKSSLSIRHSVKQKVLELESDFGTRIGVGVQVFFYGRSRSLESQKTGLHIIIIIIIMKTSKAPLTGAQRCHTVHACT